MAIDGAAAAAAAEAASHSRRLLVGGLLIEIPPEKFEQLEKEVRALVIVGTIGGWRTKKRLYLMPYNGITFYCKTETDSPLPISAVDVPKIDKGPLDL